MIVTVPEEQRTPEGFRADSFGRNEPGYRRLATWLREGVQDKKWSEGETLPTDGELGELFGVSRQTVRRAYLDLVNEGLVYRMPGKGTFISPAYLRYHRALETIDDLLSLSEDTELEVVEPLSGTYDERAAAALQLDTRLMYGLRFVRMHQGIVFCFTSVYLPPQVGRLLEGDATFVQVAARTNRTMIGALAAHGIQVQGAEQSMTARAADPLDAQNLGCDPGHPLLHAERLYLDSRGRPVEWAVSDFLPEHYTHRIHLDRAILTTVGASAGAAD